MEKKNIKFGYGTLIIILFAVICFLTDYIIIDRKMNENSGSSSNSSSVNNSGSVDSSKNYEVISLDEVNGLIDSQLYVLNGKASLSDLTNQKKLSLALGLLKKSNGGNYPSTFTSNQLEDSFKSSVFGNLNFEHENIIAVKSSELDGNIGYGCSYSNNVYTDCVSTNSGSSRVNIIYSKVSSFSEDNGKYILSVKYLWGGFGETLFDNNNFYSKYSDSVNKLNSIGTIPYEVLGNDSDLDNWAKNNISTYEDSLETYNYVFVKENGKINIVDFYVK